MYNYRAIFLLKNIDAGYCILLLSQRLGILVSAVLLSQTGYGDIALPTVSQNTGQANSDANCQQSYFEQTLPKISNEKYASDTLPLCFNGFAVMYSGLSRTALWSAENLTRDRVEQASNLERVNNFHPEARLPNSIKAELADYSHSAYDRGHLSPNGDMATPEQQYDSFSLANIVPQNAQNNRYLWKDIESHTRYLTIKYGQVYVVTGVAFLGQNVKQLNQRILIPTHLYKAIYVPKLQQAGVYFSPNDDSQRVEVISLTELNQRVGINAFPNVSDAIKNKAMPLPTAAKTPSVTPKSNPQISPDDIAVLLVKVFWAVIQWLSSLLKN